MIPCHNVMVRGPKSHRMGPSVAKPLGPKDVVARGSEKKSQSNDSASLDHAERHNMPRQGTRSLLATVTFMLPRHSSLCPPPWVVFLKMKLCVDPESRRARSEAKPS